MQQVRTVSSIQGKDEGCRASQAQVTAAYARGLCTGPGKLATAGAVGKGLLCCVVLWQPLSLGRQGDISKLAM
jgi:hypothetical protein